MTIKPIRSQQDYEAACVRLDEIFQAEEGTPEDEELEVLLCLVDDYEEKHFPINMPHPIEAVKIQMNNLGLDRKALQASLSKSSGRVSDILNQRRRLTLDDIRTLSRLLHIPLEVLAQEYPVISSNKKGSQRPHTNAAAW